VTLESSWKRTRSAVIGLGLLEVQDELDRSGSVDKCGPYRFRAAATYGPYGRVVQAAAAILDSRWRLHMNAECLYGERCIMEKSWELY